MPFFVELFRLLQSLFDLVQVVVEAYSAHKARGERYVPKHMGKRCSGRTQHKKDRL